MSSKLLLERVFAAGVLAACVAISACDRNPMNLLPGGGEPTTAPPSSGFPDRQTQAAADATVRAADYASLHDAVKNNPGKVIDIGAGDWTIDRRLLLRTDRSGLRGTGRIIQTNPKVPIVEVRNAQDVSISEVTLMRPAADSGSEAEGLLAVNCRYLSVDRVKVVDNRANRGAISLEKCFFASIRNSTVRNYMKVAIDDRTQNTQHWGYAFYCTDGTGIAVRSSEGTLLLGNIVTEDNLLPTPEMQKAHKLGSFARKNATKGSLISQEAWDAGYVSNWQQGSAIWVGQPEETRYTRIIGNHIRNAAQGIDLHCDQVIVSGNIVENAFMGMKAMHGSRNVLIEGNQFSRNVLWSIGLQPGAASHAGKTAEDGTSTPPNVDGWSIIANNIISDFGHGDAWWIWKDVGMARTPLRFDAGQEPDDPPLDSVVVAGNVVQAVADDTTPRFEYAVMLPVPDSRPGPQNVKFLGNILPAGSRGVANLDLEKTPGSAGTSAPATPQ